MWIRLFIFLIATLPLSAFAEGSSSYYGYSPKTELNRIARGNALEKKLLENAPLDQFTHICGANDSLPAFYGKILSIQEESFISNYLDNRNIDADYLYVYKQLPLQNDLKVRIQFQVKKIYDSKENRWIPVSKDSVFTHRFFFQYGFSFNTEKLYFENHQLRIPFDDGYNRIFTFNGYSKPLLDRELSKYSCSDPEFLIIPYEIRWTFPMPQIEQYKNLRKYATAGNFENAEKIAQTILADTASDTSNSFTHVFKPRIHQHRDFAMLHLFDPENIKDFLYSRSDPLHPAIEEAVGLWVKTSNFKSRLVTLTPEDRAVAELYAADLEKLPQDSINQIAHRVLPPLNNPYLQQSLEKQFYTAYTPGNWSFDMAFELGGPLVVGAATEELLSASYPAFSLEARFVYRRIFAEIRVSAQGFDLKRKAYQKKIFQNAKGDEYDVWISNTGLSLGVHFLEFNYFAANLYASLLVNTWEIRKDKKKWRETNEFSYNVGTFFDIFFTPKHTGQGLSTGTAREEHLRLGLRVRAEYQKLEGPDFNVKNSGEFNLWLGVVMQLYNTYRLNL